MGYGDNEPPAIRADAVPATLQRPSGFAMLFLTFVAWDVIKLSWSSGAALSGRIEIGSGRINTEYFFQPAESGQRYAFTAQGCNKAVDGSTNYCSPVSVPFDANAAQNTTSLKQFLFISGINLNHPVSLRAALGSRPVPISLRTVMGLSRDAHP